MQFRLKFLTAIFCCLVCFPTLAADIIVVTHGQENDPFWDRVKAGVDLAAKQTGAHVDYRAPKQFDIYEMEQMINAAVQEKPDGLAVSIPDHDALGDAILGAVAAGIPVISFNSGSDASKQLGALLHVGQDEFEAGKAAGKRLAELGGRKGICINQELGNVALDLRCSGFAEGFRRKVGVLPTSNDPVEIEAEVKKALIEDPDIDTILALGASAGGEASVKAVKSLDRSEPVRIASFDLSKQFLAAIMAGDAVFAIDQQQFLQGYLPVTLLALHAEYGLMPGGDIQSGPNFVTKETASRVMGLGAVGIR